MIEINAVATRPNFTMMNIQSIEEPQVCILCCQMKHICLQDNTDNKK